MGTIKRILFMAILPALVLVLGFGGAAMAQLAAAGPINELTGFPAWYEDSNGIQLQICDEGPNNNPPCFKTLFNPFGGVVNGNINEVLYYSAEATVTGPNGEIFQGIFAIEAIEFPDTVSNVRRIRLRNFVVAGQYTVTTPFGGPFVFTAVQDIDGTFQDVDSVVPVNGLPPDFGGALNGAVDVFSSNGTSLDPRFLGDGLTPGPLNPQPAGGGVFRVVGPGGSGIDESTDQFIVVGKTFGLTMPDDASATFVRDALGGGSIEITVPERTGLGQTIEVEGDPVPLPGGEPANGFLLVESLLAPREFILDAPMPVAAADILPGNVIATFDRGLATEATLIIPLTDLVTVTSATFDPAAGNTLTVVATSSNRFSNGGADPLPVLTVTNPSLTGPGALLGTIDTAVTDTLTTSGVFIRPVNVVVASDDGGTVRSAVANVTPGDPDAPAAPAGVGGGGGGGCFIAELFN